MNSPANGARWRNENSAVDARSDKVQHGYSMLCNVKCRLKQKSLTYVSRTQKLQEFKELQNGRPAFRPEAADSGW
jgi:hypothetical protein